ncbi:MAG: hypothetical protein ABIH46_10780 [Chloroflexota bacterium]
MSKRTRKARRRDENLRQKAEAEAKPPVMRGQHSSEEYRVVQVRIVTWPLQTRSW